MAATNEIVVLPACCSVQQCLSVCLSMLIVFNVAFCLQVDG